MSQQVKERIKAIFKERNIKYKDVAAKIGINHSTFSSFFSNAENKILTLDLVIKIGEALNVSPLWLAYGKGIYRLDEALQTNRKKPLFNIDRERVNYFSSILANYFEEHPDNDIISVVFVDSDGSAESIKINPTSYQIVEEKRESH